MDRTGIEREEEEPSDRTVDRTGMKDLTTTKGLKTGLTIEGLKRESTAAIIS